MDQKKVLEGIEKLHTAEIILIISSVLSILGLIVLLASDRALNPDELAVTDPTTSGIVWMLILEIAAVVLAVISNILNVVALKRAKDGDVLFKPGFYISIMMLIIFIISGFGVSNEESLFAGIIEILEELGELALMVIIITGLKKFITKFGGDRMLRFANIMRALVAIMLALSLIGAILHLTGLEFVESIKVASYVFSLVSFILYLIFVARAIKFLKRNIERGV